MNPTESYCDHLRGQLKDWQRAFRIKKGRLPSREDFEALKDDGSSRARIVYDAYTALNQATGNSFSKVRFQSTQHVYVGIIPTLQGSPSDRTVSESPVD